MTAPLPRNVRVLAWMAAACFLASWFLPVGDGVPGWMAFRIGLSPLWPYRDFGMPSWEDGAISIMSASTNLVMPFLLVPLLVPRPEPLRNGLFLRIAIACFLLDLWWFVQLWRDESLDDLRIGYYVWMAAFGLLVAIGLVRIRAEGFSDVSVRRT